jgi:hypothetical protein
MSAQPGLIAKTAVVIVSGPPARTVVFLVGTRPGAPDVVFPGDAPVLLDKGFRGHRVPCGGPGGEGHDCIAQARADRGCGD